MWPKDNSNLFRDNRRLRPPFCFLSVPWPLADDIHLNGGTLSVVKMSTTFQCRGKFEKKKQGKRVTSTFVAHSGGVLQDDGIAVQKRSFGVRRQQRQRVAGPQSKFANVQLERHRLDQLTDGAFARRRNL